MELNIIVAAAENNVIGVDNKMPWRLSNDLQRFKKLTRGNVVVMGRKTYESLGKALPERKNVVLTRNESFAPADAIVVYDVEEAMDEVADEEQVFVIGGGEVYRQFMPLAHRIYLTRVHTRPEGDTHFEDIDADVWTLESSEAHVADAKNNYDFTYETYLKK